MTNTRKQLFLNIVLVTVIMIFSVISLSYADNKIVDILPPTTIANDGEQEISNPTHPILRLTPDKSELIYLEKEASSIIVGNPLHINVIADSSKTLVIVPRALGATYFTILGKNGQIIMQRHVIVAGSKENYIRIKRTCSSDAKNCQSTSVFYCPDMCHEIKSSEEQESSSQNSASDDNGNNSPSNEELEETE